jgi:hypothetical protein
MAERKPPALVLCTGISRRRRDPAEFPGDDEDTLAEFRRVGDPVDSAMRTWNPEVTPGREAR